jgi:23S rRNA (adenine2030-N6)-methyltransferase
MNYRHHYHAGNFADLLKHALLLALIAEMKASGRPISVIDTHAGAGLYDLMGPEAVRSGEAEVGIMQLFRQIEPPAEFSALMGAVRALNTKSDIRLYPGSPILALQALGPQDSYIGCELRDDDAAALKAAMGKVRPRGGPQVRVLVQDGYACAWGLRPDATRTTLVLIDPPFERGDEYEQLVETAARLVRLRPRPLIAIWAPIKDLETFDGLVRQLEAVMPDGAMGLVAQVRLRPLINPMKMNGTAMILLGETRVEALANAVSQWIATHIGEAGAMGRADRLG